MNDSHDAADSSALSVVSTSINRKLGVLDETSWPSDACYVWFDHFVDRLPETVFYVRALLD